MRKSGAASSSRSSARTASASRRCVNAILGLLPLAPAARSRCSAAARRGEPARSATSRSGAASIPRLRVRGRRHRAARARRRPLGDPVARDEPVATRVEPTKRGARADRPGRARRVRATARSVSCSGGEQQRLLIAQALARSPRAAAARRAARQPRPAEPGGASRRCRRASAASDGVTVLMVAHDVNPILSYLDRVVYLAAGGVGVGHPGRGDHDRDADAGCTARRSRCCATSDGRLVVGRPARGASTTRSTAHAAPGASMTRPSPAHLEPRRATSRSSSTTRSW